jgi:hypothetical protein
MNTLSLKSPRIPLCAIGAVTLLAVAHSATADGPVARSTPLPGTLAAYAQRTTLNSSALRDDSGHLTLTNAKLAELSANGTINLGAASVAARTPIKGEPSDAVRAKWRKAYFKQRDVITALERRRALLEVEIDHIEDGRLDVRGLARLERAEAKLRLLDKEIRDEHQELARVVREARRHGAQPGWFR